MPVAHGSTRRLVFLGLSVVGIDRHPVLAGQWRAGILARSRRQRPLSSSRVIASSRMGGGNARQLTNPPVPTMISAMARLFPTEDTESLKRLDYVKSARELMRQANYRLDYLWFLAVVRRMPIGAGASI